MLVKNEANDVNLKNFDSHMYRSSKRICLSKPQVPVFVKSRDLTLLETQKRVISSLYNSMKLHLADGQSLLKKKPRLKWKDLHAETELCILFTVALNPLIYIYIFFFSVLTLWNTPFMTTLSSLAFSRVLKILYITSGDMVKVTTSALSHYAMQKN